MIFIIVALAFLLLQIQGIYAMSDITQLKANLVQLQTVVANVGPVLQANTDLVGKAVGVMETLLAASKNAGPSQADIDELTASTRTALDGLNADLAQVNSANATLQAEIVKVTTP